MNRTYWSVLVAALVLAGCVSFTPPAPSPFASAASDAQAKQFAPPQGKANLYVSRPGELRLIGSPPPYGVTLDGKVLGGIMPGMYYCLSLEPGNHSLGVSSPDGADTATVRVEAGKNYYYQVDTSTTGYRTRLSLGLVILEPAGKLMVNNTRRGEASVE